MGGEQSPRFFGGCERINIYIYIYFPGESGMGSNPLAFLEGCDVFLIILSEKENAAKL